MGRVSVIGAVSLLSASRALAEPTAGGATAAFPGSSPPPVESSAVPPPATGGGPSGAAPPPSGPPPAAYYAPASAPPPATYYQPPPPGVASPPEASARKPVRRVSLTFSPLHLIQPAFIATLEVRATDHLGLALFGGLGSVSISMPSTDVIDAEGNITVQPAHTDHFAYQEVGGQIVGYPMAEFDGLELGMQLLYLHLAGDFSESSVSGVGVGTAIGPFVGYKLLTSGGFTLVVQGGAQYLWATATATSTTSGTTATDTGNRVLPLLNFTLGWSF